MTATLDLARELIKRKSITPEDEGCQVIIGERLRAIGFNVETLQYGEVINTWATWGDQGPLLAFAGHTDVVPTGDENQWGEDPFSATVKNGVLFGRGAADMKGSLAAMVVALENFLSKDRNKCEKIRLGVLLTSDEEGPAKNGTRKVIELLQERGEKIDYCIVGEPSSNEQLGDVVKIGRRGSLNGALTVLGIQGHVAYPHLADNPIHSAVCALAKLTSIEWDKGNENFPPTSLQISNISAGTGVTNVIPGSLKADFNFRFSTEISSDKLRAIVENTLLENDLKFKISWDESGSPFLTPNSWLRKAVETCIREETGLDTIQSTAGGTSDGRFIAPTGTEVVELGPSNETIHKINERVRTEDLEILKNIYLRIISHLCETTK
ncbi:succinyl-diaminopimelate desuccinylase [Gammaproteobacteria bacterium]|nr:succinyl-diaminopimelate desuccinylase [Gammaproteobacteria bacterium]MDC3239272.1 succinyl-diaminopimelate desuccinylase [Gammaproteobacteria bacterium]